MMPNAQQPMILNQVPIQEKGWCGEEADTCCCCFPIQTGVKILVIWNAIGFASWIFLCFFSIIAIIIGDDRSLDLHGTG